MSKRVLIVDDTLTIRMFTKVILSHEGFDLYEATDGEEALTLIDANRPDMILMDLIMPNMGGIECCKRIKSDPGLRDIPVIIVTTLGERAQIDEAVAAGCDDYITKPIRKIELLSKMRRLMSPGASAGAPSGPRPETGQK